MANTYGFDPVPYSVDGGTLGAEQFRLASYADGGEEEGIVTPGDCKVTALSTPGPQIQIGGGALRIKNRSANVVNQMYIANGRTTSTIDTPASSASLRSHLVVVRVEDWHYGQFPEPANADKPNYQYVKPVIIQNVPAGTKTAAALNLGYPAVALARLDVPANTTNITNAMIVDLRQVARPRSKRIVRGLNNNTLDTFAYTDTVFHNWPVAATWQIEIPSWATHFVYNLALGQIIPAYKGVATQGYIRLNVANGAILGDSVQWEVDAENDTNPFPILNADEYAIPSNLRGTTVTFKMEARRIGGTADIKWHPVSSLALDITFEERAV